MLFNISCNHSQKKSQLETKRVGKVITTRNLPLYFSLASVRKKNIKKDKSYKLPQSGGRVSFKKPDEDLQKYATTLCT